VRCSWGGIHHEGDAAVIVCVRTVGIPAESRERFFAWIEENRELRQSHGILFEVVLERSLRQNPAKAMPIAEHEAENSALVLTAWASHDAFDAWIQTPDRDRLTASDVHGSVEYGPITRYDVAGGYLSLDGLAAVAEHMREVSS
jgi:hypothetical protein